ncbi:MAG: T9SS type A sorting domain-containing protein [Bacteroidales bacterium]|nr:T9SS type A sorting domain-containing protein [Bacteroidales bacterium]
MKRKANYKQMKLKPFFRFAISLTIINICLFYTSHALSVKTNDEIDAVHYSISLQPVNFDNQEIQGSTDITLTPKIDDLSGFTLELAQLTVDSVIYDDQLLDYTHPDPELNIILSNPVSITDTITLSIYYHGEPFVDPSNWGGFHFSGNYAFNLGVGFESDPHNLGKAWFPCVDDFVDRATYDLYITTDEEHTAVCGGTLLEETNNGDGTKTYHWKMFHSLPTYLASVAIGDYEAVRDTFAGIEEDIPIAIYVRPGNVNDVEGSFTNLKDILVKFEESFGPYPWSRVGFVGTAIGAMEHAANVAYPSFAIDNTLEYEWLYAHELSHMWLGDKVTCASAEDMWLNEGWAVFCESLYREGLSGEEAYKENMRTLLHEVLQYTHITDDGYRALYGIPTEYTYGSTVYDKGGIVVHTLRNYLGDEVFFDAVKAYLEEFAYNSASSWDLRDFITTHTGVDMTDFFDAWVFSPGFPHFSIDSINATEEGNEWEVDIYMKQKLKGKDTYAHSNIVDITFMDANHEMFTDTIMFSGKTGHGMITAPFEPEVAFCDLHEKIADATTDNYKVISETGEYTFPDTYFNMTVNDITDSAFMRVTHNWAAPDSLKEEVEGLILSDYRYWEIKGIFPESFNAKGEFFYSKGSYLDDGLLTDPADSLVILYRPGAHADWQAIPFEKFGPYSIGYIYVDNLQPGQYTLAVWDDLYVGLNETSSLTEDLINIYPNPAEDEVNIESHYDGTAIIELFDSKGHKLMEKRIDNGKQQFQWQTSDKPSGQYILRLSDEKGKPLSYEKFIIQTH